MAEGGAPRLRVHTFGGDVVLVDPERVPRPGPDLFDPEHWRSRGRVDGRAHGRGVTWFVRGEGDEPWVLRRYRRGGAMARLSEDAYLRLGIARSRPFRELRLLAALRASGLPVPAPVGARVRLEGWRYRGDLLTVRAPGRPLYEQIREARPDPGPWAAAGSWIRAFHDAGLDHPDLHGDNLLVEGETVHLIDLDRARVRRPGGSFARRNLARFRRSLRKRLGSEWEVGTPWAACWKAFEGGYAEGIGGRPAPARRGRERP